MMDDADPDYDDQGEPTPEAVARWRRQLLARHAELFPESDDVRARLREALRRSGARPARA